ncbi:MAG: YbjN domain-containing protein [Acidimicrobiales bacterium]
MQSPLTIETVTNTVEMLDLSYWVSPDSAGVLVPFGPTDEHAGYDVILEIDGNVLSSRIVPKDLEELAVADPGAVLAICNLWNRAHRWPTAVFEAVPRPFLLGNLNQHFAVAPTPEQLLASIELPLATGAAFVRFLVRLVGQGGLALDDEALSSLLDIDDAA